MANITFFKDLPLDFTPHPVSGDVRPITNEVAIKRAIKNIVLTRKGAKPFDPDYGCDLDNFLFSTPDGITEYDFSESIKNAIINYEPRVTIDNIRFLYSEHNANIIIDYTIKNIGSRDQVITTLTRTA